MASGQPRVIFLADDKFKIFCGTANPSLAQEICQYVGVPVGNAEHGQFSDGEIRYQILENVPRGSERTQEDLRSTR